MTTPQISQHRFKILLLATRILGLLGMFALLFALMQSCSVPKNNLQRFAEGNLKKLVVLDKPPVQPTRSFKNIKGQDVKLQDFRGKIVLLNIWATWCVPCVAEIPSLNQLQKDYGGEEFEIVAISIDRSIADAQDFFVEQGIENLSLYHDLSLGIGSDVNVGAFPISVFYDQKGREIARIPGEVDWQSDEVRAFLTAIIYP
jgi:thiol-disulfide isomerase/thioredoxin